MKYHLLTNSIGMSFLKKNLSFKKFDQSNMRKLTSKLYFQIFVGGTEMDI